MNASSWLNLRLIGVFTSDSLTFYPTLGNSRKNVHVLGNVTWRPFKIKILNQES